MFAAFPDLSFDQLAHDISQHILLKLGEYRPSKAKFSTWVHRLAWCKLFDICKIRMRRGRNETRMLEERGRFGADPMAYEETAPDLDTIPDWLTEKMREYSEQAPPRWQRATGRPKLLNPAQAATIVSLSTHLGMSIRGVCRLLRSNPEILKLMGLDRAPSPMCFSRIKLSVTKLRFSSSRPTACQTAD